MARALKRSHDKLYRTFEQKEVYIRKGSLARIRLRSLLEILSKLRGETVLDVGCAVGVFTLSMAENRSFCVGLDFVKVSLMRLRRAAARKTRTNIDVILSDAHYLPIRNKSFDIVLCSEVLEHVLKPEKVLDELKRVSNLYVVISVPCVEFIKKKRYVPCENEKMESHISHLLRETKTIHIHTFTINDIFIMIKDSGLKPCIFRRVLFTVPGLALVLALFPSLERIVHYVDEHLFSRVPLYEIPHTGFGNKYTILVCKVGD
jgi:ubiquinone/menaquinone biosynthesis C-methylase UbiE